jgi:hypothetical protein
MANHRHESIAQSAASGLKHANPAEAPLSSHSPIPLFKISLDPPDHTFPFPQESLLSVEFPTSYTGMGAIALVLGCTLL